MPGINLSTRPLNLKLKHPFGLSRGITYIAKNVLVTLTFEDYVAYGEAAPSAFYGEDQKSVIEFINAFAKNRSLDSYLANINKLKEDMNAFNLSMNRTVNSNLFSYSARLALEIAFWDLIGKINNKPTFECLFNSNPFLEKQNNGGLPKTSFTISIDELSIMEAKTKEALRNGFDLLKIKLGLGYERDLEILNTISEAAKDYKYSLRVDANGGWDLETTKRFVDILPEYNVDLIEQPLRKGSSHELAGVIHNSTIPIVADEDCMNINDIESLAGKVHGINIKLMKTGSLIDAIEMINLAKSYNLKVMVGCMIESSCAISAAVNLTPFVDYVDLDGHLLLDNDPFSGLILEGNKILPSFNDGLGVNLKEI